MKNTIDFGIAPIPVAYPLKKNTRKFFCKKRIIAHTKKIATCIVFIAFALYLWSNGAKSDAMTKNWLVQTNPPCCTQ